MKRIGIDKSDLMFGISKPLRDRRYLDSFEGATCWGCGKIGCVGAHVNVGAKGMGSKSGDDRTMPLCADCHRDMDTCPNGVPWWIVIYIVLPLLGRRYSEWKLNGLSIQLMLP